MRRRSAAETLSLTDNARYCVFARFCHPAGDAWTLTEHSDDPTSRRLAIREGLDVPRRAAAGLGSGYGQALRVPLRAQSGADRGSGDRQQRGSLGPGRNPLRRENGRTYEIRNRMVLCRCGQSANKPYCDGTHAAVKWRDELDSEPVGETLPEEVY